MIRQLISVASVVAVLSLGLGSEAMAYSHTVKNPCAAKQPCAAKNPCAAKQPAAAKNPCAAQSPRAGDQGFGAKQLLDRQEIQAR